MTIRGLAHVVFACLVTSFADGCGASINTLKIDFILFYSMAPLRAEFQGPIRATEAGVFSRFAISWMQPAVKQKKRLSFSNGRSLTFEIPEILAGWFVDIGPYPAPKNCFSKVCSFTTEIDANLLLHSELNQDNVMRGICVGWNRWNYPYFYALADSEIIGWRDK